MTIDGFWAYVLLIPLSFIILVSAVCLVALTCSALGAWYEREWKVAWLFTFCSVLGWLTLAYVLYWIDIVWTPV